MALITVIAGGVGAAKFLRGLVEVVDPGDVTAVVNVADDFRLHGLAISPDLDTVTYTLADLVNPETGWGRQGESWTVMEELEHYGGATWFSLGDRDLALHLYRTQRLAEGAALSEVTSEVTRSHGLDVTVLPVTDEPVATKLIVDGREIDFQDYFVARRHDVTVSAVRFTGVEAARPAPGVLEAIDGADVVVVAPSNPIVSIGPVLSVPGLRDALVQRRDRVVGVSPIVGGAALKGPAARLMTELGHPSTAVGVAQLYQDVAGTLVIDEIDAVLATDVTSTGVRCVVADTIMSDPQRAAAVARSTLAAGGLEV